MKPLNVSLIKKKILSAIGKGDILLIVPPFVTTKTPILGPHILQSIANQLGHKAEILHLNLLLASIIGLSCYESVCYGQPFRMLGERLFARSAFGLPPLGKSPERCFDPTGSIYGNHQEYFLEEFEYKYTNTPDFDPDIFFNVEEICNSFIQEVSQTIASLDYRIIACSTNWEQNNCSIALLNGIKHIRQDIITIIGGANCEGEMAEGIGSLSDSIDYIFSGESETSFADFLESYSANNLPSHRIIVGKPLKDLDTIPLSTYANYIKQKRCFLGEDSLEDWAIGHETSRGCWWGKCYFCGMNGVERARFRQKTTEKAFAELEEIYTHYPNRGVAMVDKVMPRSYQEELLPKLSQNKSSSPLFYEQRSNLPLKDLILLGNARVRQIKPGIEALSTGLLKLMNKGINARQNILLLRNAAALGIYVDWNLLWGFPGDKAAHYEETLKILPLIRHLCPPAVFRHICIDRFSPYFERVRDFGIKRLRPWDVYKMVYPDWADVGKLAYRFIGDYPCEAHEHPELIREIAEKIEGWKNTRENSNLTMIPLGDYYMVYDSRGINEKSKNHLLDASQSKEVMAYCIYDKSENQKWAVEQKLGVVVDGWYVPLVTASPELLLAFEDNSNCQEN